MIMIGARRCAQHGQRARERTKEWFHACFHLIVKEQVLNGQRTDSTVDGVPNWSYNRVVIVPHLI